ncbi:MAG: HTH-type transcriptional regulator, sugar sensing transcriptional regulator [Thermoplasmata archaeon]|nr:HTH-type transcriptional regulator, sugar sensing transcriptional regulator [Thermoplasmata archaeon]
MDRLAVLLEHGLSEYQARVYLALLDFPSLPAGSLAKAAQIPRNRLYEILEELQAMGLVEILLEENRKYRATPLGLYLDRSVADLRDRIGKIEAQKSYLEVAFKPPTLSGAEDLEAGTTRVILTRRAVAREIDRLVDETNESLVVACSAGGWERVVRHLARFPAEKKGGLTLVVPRAASSAGGVERLVEAWPSSVRWTEAPLRTLALVRDEQELLLVHPLPDDDKMRVGRDFGLLTTNLALARDHAALLRESSKP